MNSETIISPDTERENRIPPGQRLTEKWPILHEGPVQVIDEDKWSIEICGLVEKAKITYPELTSLPRVKVYSDIHCVTGWSKLDVNWEGISTSAIKSVVNILPEAKFVIVHCAGDYTTNLSLDDYFQDDVLFALERDGEKIEPKYGHPVRLVLPRLYYWKSAKWINGLEFVAEDRPGFWESRGYHNRGDPWKEERYSNPSS